MTCSRAARRSFEATHDSKDASADRGLRGLRIRSLGYFDEGADRRRSGRCRQHQGRPLCIPVLPAANYFVWVRGYGLRDSKPVKAAREREHA